MTTNALSITKSLPCQETIGKCVQHSERDVVVHSLTPDEKLSSERKAKILCVIVDKLLGEVLSPDVMILALGAAKDELLKSGYTKQEWNQVAGAVLQQWKKRRDANPMSCMF